MNRLRIFLFMMILGLFWSLGAYANQGNQAEAITLSGYTPEGQKKWDLSADTAEVFSNREINLANPTGVLYEKGSPNVWIEAKEGIYSPGEENVHLKKEVVVKDADGTTLETKSLDWSSEESVLKTKEDIKLCGEGPYRWIK